MIRPRGGAALAALALLVLLSGCWGNGSGGSQVATRTKGLIDWETDYETAAARASVEHRNLLIKFHGVGWGSCATLERVTFQDPDVAAKVKDYVPLALDVDRHPELFRRFGGRAIPMIVWARPDGTKVKGIVGYRSPAAFLREFPE